MFCQRRDGNGNKSAKVGVWEVGVVEEFEETDKMTDKIKLPKSVVDNHRALWGWLAETGTEHKSEYIGFTNREDRILNYCHFCEFAGIIRAGADSRINCDVCPGGWTDEHCEADESEYLLWCDAETPEERKEIAAQIRDIPIRDIFEIVEGE